jgi:hypothetical protein
MTDARVSVGNRIDKQEVDMNVLRPFLSRVVAPWIAAAFLALALKFGLAPDEVLANRVAETVIEVILWVVPALLSITGIFKQFIDRKVNPADAASGHLAYRGKLERENVDATR